MFLFLSILLTILESARPVHTYSIVARDPETGAMGVAVQSHWFSVGSAVTWGEAGVGVVWPLSPSSTRAMGRSAWR